MLSPPSTKSQGRIIHEASKAKALDLGPGPPSTTKIFPIYSVGKPQFFSLEREKNCGFLNRFQTSGPGGTMIGPLKS